MFPVMRNAERSQWSDDASATSWAGSGRSADERPARGNQRDPINNLYEATP